MAECPACFGTGRNRRGGPCNACFGRGEIGGMWRRAVTVGVVVRALFVLAIFAIVVWVVIAALAG